MQSLSVQLSQGTGSSTLASLTKRRIRDRVPFPLPDYVFDMHTIEGQNRGRSYEHFISQAAVVFPEAVLMTVQLVRMTAGKQNLQKDGKERKTYEPDTCHFHRCIDQR